MTGLEETRFREKLIAMLHEKACYSRDHLKAQTTQHLVHLRNRVRPQIGLTQVGCLKVDRHAAKLTR